MLEFYIFCCTIVHFAHLQTQENLKNINNKINGENLNCQAFNMNKEALPLSQEFENEEGMQLQENGAPIPKPATIRSLLVFVKNFFFKFTDKKTFGNDNN